MISYYDVFRNNWKRFGIAKAFLGLGYKIIRKVILFEVVYILLHDRAKLKNPSRKIDEEISFKVATEDDLKSMMGKEEYWVDHTKLEWLHKGELCLLNYSNGEIAGYTHAHLKGEPIIKDFIQLELPDNMIYNYAGLTVPKFRGRKHHAIRHYELMQLPQCKDIEYMMSYVNLDNFAAIRGGLKGGRFVIGYIVIYGFRKKRYVKLTGGLNKYNIKLKGLIEPDEST